MKRCSIFVFLVWSLLFAWISPASALDFKILDLRGKIFEESKAIRTAVNESEDVLILMSMFDSCVVTITQLDAYFAMLGIFYSINKQELTQGPLDFLVNWLTEMKSTTDVHMKTVTSISGSVEPVTSKHMVRLKEYFTELNALIDEELEKVAILKDSVQETQR